MSNTLMATSLMAQPPPDTKVDPYQDPAYNQPNPLTENQTTLPIHLDFEMQACIDLCLDCHKTCLSESLDECLEMGGLHCNPQHFQLMSNCADICQTSANFMVSNSQFSALVCEVCAQVCEACAESCDSFGGMEHAAMQCRKCAESCLHMAQTAA